jgi:hypothetical protein
MARFVAVADTVLDGLKVPKGTVVNVPSSVKDIKNLAPLPDPATGAAGTTTPLYTVPRARFTAAIGAGFVDLATLPPYLRARDTYINGSFVDQPMNEIGRQTSTGQLPPNSAGPNSANVIVEPVVPTANSQYD